MTETEKWNHYASACPKFTLIYLSLADGPVEGGFWYAD